MNCQTFSTGLSSGDFGGRAMMVMLGGTVRCVDLGVAAERPEEVRVHDFLVKGLGRAVPYGVYDLAADGYVVSDKEIAAIKITRAKSMATGTIRYLPIAAHIVPL